MYTVGVIGCNTGWYYYTLLKISRKITVKGLATRLPGLSPLFYGRPVISFTADPLIYGQFPFYLTGILLIFTKISRILNDNSAYFNDQYLFFIGGFHGDLPLSCCKLPL